MELFDSPFSKEYWRAAVKELKSVRVLVFCSLMIAAAIALGLIAIPIPGTTNLKISTAYLARALAAMVGGPVVGLLYGFAEDIIGWLINPGGPFFFGYTLDTMLAVLVYALFFYRQKLTMWKLIGAKLITNYPISVGLGCLWSHMLYGKGYLYYFTTSMIKNTVYLPIQVLLLFIVFRSLIPSMKKLKYLPADYPEEILWTAKSQSLKDQPASFKAIRVISWLVVYGIATFILIKTVELDHTWRSVVITMALFMGATLVAGLVNYCMDKSANK